MDAGSSASSLGDRHGLSHAVQRHRQENVEEQAPALGPVLRVMKADARLPPTRLLLVSGSLIRVQRLSSATGIVCLSHYLYSHTRRRSQLVSQITCTLSYNPLNMDRLPEDLLLRILEFADLAHLFKLMQVNRGFEHACRRLIYSQRKLVINLCRRHGRQSCTIPFKRPRRSQRCSCCPTA